jgi:hypothetical protein
MTASSDRAEQEHHLSTPNGDGVEAEPHESTASELINDSCVGVAGKPIIRHAVNVPTHTSGLCPAGEDP